MGLSSCISEADRVMIPVNSLKKTPLMKNSNNYYVLEDFGQANGTRDSAERTRTTKRHGRTNANGIIDLASVF